MAKPIGLRILIVLTALVVVIACGGDRARSPSNDVTEARIVLDGFFSSTRAMDADALLDKCDPDLVASVGRELVRQALLTGWAITSPANERIENVTVISQDENTVTFGFDLFFGDRFIARLEDARVIRKSGEWWNTAPSCTSTP